MKEEYLLHGVHTGLAKYQKGECIWKRYAICNILKNPVYIGTMVGAKTYKKNNKVKKSTVNPIEKRCIVLNTHTAIIDEEIFNRANNKLKVLAGSRKRKYDHELKGLIYCAECGARATIKAKTEQNKNGTTRTTIYFICGRKNSDKNSCINGSMTANKIYNSAIESIKSECNKIVYSKEELDKTFEEAKQNVDSKKSIIKKKIKEQQKQIDILEKQAKEIYKDKLNKLISVNDFSRFYKEIQENIVNFSNEISRLTCQLEVDSDVKMASHKEMRKMAEDFLNIEQINKNILIKLIEKIEITKDKQIKIKYKFAECA